MKIYDIAGLVKGASTGAGLGNAFLSNISGVDGIYHMVRAFDDMSVSHEEGDVDPVRDMDIIHAELAAKDLQQVTKVLTDLDSKILRSNDKASKDLKEIIDKCRETLEGGLWIKDAKWTPNEIFFIN